MTKYLTDEEIKTVNIVASKNAYKWEAIEKEDLQQHLYIFLLKKYDRALKRWRTEEHGQKKLYKALKTEAIKYCVKEQAITNGEHTLSTQKTMKTTYTYKQIATALEYIYEYDYLLLNQTSTHPQYENTIIEKPESEKLIDLMLDIKRTIENLNPAEQILIRYRFQEGRNFKEIGELLSTTEDAARMRISRLIKQITKTIG